MKTLRHPGGLYLLSATEMAERFGFYGMKAILVYYLLAAFFQDKEAYMLIGSFMGLIYLTPIIGGYVADRYLGNRKSIVFGGVLMAIGHFLLFASASSVNQSIFAKGGQICDSVDNTLPLILMISGLCALIIGNGFFKPNISSMVGDLYRKEEDKDRKERAFDIFYEGINIGGFLAPILCGFLAKDGGWENPSAYKWGFLCAGIVMALAVLAFIIGKDRLLVGPNGQPIGLVPTNRPHSNMSTETKDNRGKNSPLRIGICIIVAILLAILFSRNADNFNGYISAIIYSASICLPIMIITDKGLTRQEKLKIGVIFIIACFSIVFWTCYEQGGTSLSVFADRQCNRMIGHFEFQAAWLQSINPVAIILLGPLMVNLWKMLERKKRNPSVVVKQGLGLLLMSFGYLIIAFGTQGLSEGAIISMWWLWGLYVVHALAEWFLSPIGLSMVKDLSPVRFSGLMMGIWFMSQAVSEVLSGKLATYLPESGHPIKHFLGFEIASLPDFFMIFAALSGIAGVLLLALSPCLKKMMGNTVIN